MPISTRLATYGIQPATKRAQRVIFRFQEISKYRYKHVQLCTADVTKMAPSVSAKADTCSSHVTDCAGASEQRHETYASNELLQHTFHAHLCRP
jgi:hypothetical protein